MIQVPLLVFRSFLSIFNIDHVIRRMCISSFIFVTIQVWFTWLLKAWKFFGFPWRGLVKVETLTLFLINNFKRLRIKIEFLLCKIPSFPKSWTFHFLNNPLTIHPILIVAVAKRFLSRIKIHDVIIRWLTFIGKIIRLLLRLGRKLWGHANEGSRL